MFLFLCSLSIKTTAETIQLEQLPAPLYSSPGQNEIAVLLKAPTSTAFLNKHSKKQVTWLELQFEGWIWKNSTNYKKNRKQIIVLADNENFRIAPNKTTLAQLKYNSPLTVLKAGRNWLKVKISGWIDASQTNFKEEIQVDREEAAISISSKKEDKSVETFQFDTQETIVSINEESPPLMVKRTILPPEEEKSTPLPQPSTDNQSNVNSFLSNMVNSDLPLIGIFAGILIVLLLSLFIVILGLSRRLSNQKIQQENKLNELMVELQNNLAAQLNSNLTPLHESTAQGLEKNRGDIALLIERRMSEFNEKLFNNVSNMRLKIAESLNHSNQSQAKAFVKFQSHFSDSVDSSLKRNLDSLNKMFNELRQSTDRHMKEINERVEDRLKKGFEQTNKIFIDIKERLNQIDQAQKRISELSNNVVSLQKTLDNKGARGAFGEVQLAEIVKDMIPEKFCKFQYTLSNEKRPDCVILLPPPTGKLIIDAKFPLENYKQMLNPNSTQEDKNNAQTLFKRDIKKHIKDISGKYILPGETADGAVMFIPSEAVFAEIHAHHPDLVKESQLKRVWMASPTTLMALLTTARAVLADDERSKQAKIIHEHLSALAVEFNRFSKRMDDLAKHINLAHEDVNKINISAKKITDKFEQIENTELDDLPKKQAVAIDGKISA